jgi:GMP synthase-like glutamine amidotransferase
VQVLVVRHHEEDSAGFVAEALAARGATVTTLLFPDEGPLPDPSSYDHVVVLGSKWSAYDSLPWIEDELEWLRRATRPVLGICFGAQLLTTAFGGRVERSPVYEIGWVEVHPVPGARPAIGPGPWLQFHGDRCILPPSATLLASNGVGVQAFTVGPHLGVQFHPEVDAEQLREWIDKGGRAAVEEAGQDPDALLAETATEEDGARRRADELVEAYLSRSVAGA